jgi:hypothetical protein
MLTLQSSNGHNYEIEKYEWDAGEPKVSSWHNGRKVGDFKCTFKDVDIGLVAEAIKGGGSWWSTDGGGCPHAVRIIITEDMLTSTGDVTEQTITFDHFRYETWDHKGYDVEITGQYVE